MDRKRRVLVFPGSTEIGLEIWRSLRYCRNVSLCSAGSVSPSHADFVFEDCYLVPDVNGGDWVEPLNRAVEEAGADYVYPAHDDVVLALAREASRVDAHVITSPVETCEVARSKLKTYELLRGTLPVPGIYEPDRAARRLPVFLKPDVGQGSAGAERVDTELALRAALERAPGLIVMENLEGREYTVDCFSDREKGLLFAGGRERVRTRSGISMHSVPVENALFEEYALAISRKLELHGAWFFQVKESSRGELVLLELAPRISGTMATHRVTGVNFPLLSIMEHERSDYEVRPEGFRVEIERALVNRYRHDLEYRVVYVDVDDTLILEGRVNWELAGFLYQCLNKGRRLVAISRSRPDPSATLSRHRLLDLFDEVIPVGPSEEKTDFMDPEGSILIDDSYSERMKARAAGMATFDCSMIELLIDHRA